MPLATKLSEVCDRAKLLLEDEAATLGIAEGCIFYGDQDRLPGYPAVCVEPDVKPVEMYGAGRMTQIVLRIYILVYHGEVKNSESTNRRDADILAETIADLFNADGTFFGLAIHAFVSEVKSGYSLKQQGTTVRSTRLQFDVKSQERLPNNP
jgi:hypothetical protein